MTFFVYLISVYSIVQKDLDQLLGTILDCIVESTVPKIVYGQTIDSSILQGLEYPHDQMLEPVNVCRVDGEYVHQILTLLILLLHYSVVSCL